VATQKTNFVTGDAAFAVDMDGEIITWNSAAEKTFGYSAETALGQRCWQMLEGKDGYGNRYCCERCPLREMAFQHESVHSLQLSLKTASGKLELFNINCLSVFSGPGEELLLHICNPPEESPEYAENNHSATRPSANSHRGALTNREQETLTLLADGKTTREIASMMCISYPTVRNHIQKTLYKLHVHNRLEAVVTGQRLNIV
jgi:DNA-binding CsgD family transcriptional regulator